MPVYIKNTVTGSSWQQLAAASYQSAAAQKEQLCVGKAEVGVSRGECFHSVQNNSWLPDQHWKASAFFFFFFFFLLRCPAATQTHSCAGIFEPVKSQQHTAFGSNDLTVKAAPGRKDTVVFGRRQRGTSIQFNSDAVDELCKLLCRRQIVSLLGLVLIKEVNNIPIRH